VHPQNSPPDTLPSKNSPHDTAHPQNSLQKQIDIQINQLKIQINQRVDDRFNSAINLLGSSETSARTGAL
jgi:hypothetical protein